MESGHALPLPRMQSFPLPPAGGVSKGMAPGTSNMLAIHESAIPTDQYAMSAQERAKYERLFPMYDTDQDGYITGQEAHALFSKSGLPREVSTLLGNRIQGSGSIF